MKKCFSQWLALVLLLLVPTASNAAVKRGDVVFYENFEGGLTHISSTDYANMTKETGYGGTGYGIKLVSNDPTYGSQIAPPLTSTELDKVKGARVRFSYKVKAQSVTSGKIKLMLWVHSTSQGYQAMEAYPPDTNIASWTNIQSMGQIPQDADSIQFYAGVAVGGTGTVWVDDMRVEVTRPWRKRATTISYGSVTNTHPELSGLLRGTNCSTGLADWPDKLNDAGYAYNMNVLRVYLMPNTGTIPYDASFTGATYQNWLNSELPQLDKLLVQAQAKGIKVLIDLHAIPGGMDDSLVSHRIFEKQQYQDDAVTAWNTLVDRYKNNPAIWGYDLLNEPSDYNAPLSPDFNAAPGSTTPWLGGWNELATKLCNVIRAKDTKHAIIVECEHQANTDGMNWMTPITNTAGTALLSNIVYSFHEYTPIEYTHQRVMFPYDTALPSNIDTILVNDIAPVTSFQTDYNAQIFVGEFSAARWSDQADAYLSKCIALFESHNWDWCYHAFRASNEWNPELTNVRTDTTTLDYANPRLAVLKTAWGANKKPSFTLKPSFAPTMRLDLAGGVVAGSAAVLKQSSTAATQQWVFTVSYGDYYLIQPASNLGLALEVPGANDVDNWQLKLHAVNSNWEQQWKVEINSDNTYSITPHHTVVSGTNRLMEVMGSSGASGAQVTLHSPASPVTPNQRWSFGYDNFGTSAVFKLKPSSATGKRLDLTAGITSGSAAVVNNALAGAAGQNWTLTPSYSGFYLIQPVSNLGLALESPSANDADDWQLKLGTANENWGQQWMPTLNSDGTYTLTPHHTIVSTSNRLMEVTGATTNVALHTPANPTATNQRWTFSAN